MPRGSILSAAERENLLRLPDIEEELTQQYTLNQADPTLIQQRRGDANRLGMAVQPCLMKDGFVYAGNPNLD